MIVYYDGATERETQAIANILDRYGTVISLVASSWPRRWWQEHYIIWARVKDDFDVAMIDEEIALLCQKPISEKRGLTKEGTTRKGGLGKKPQTQKPVPPMLSCRMTREI